MTGESLLGQLEVLDIDTADAGGVMEGLDAIRRLRGTLDSLEARLIRRAAALQEGDAGSPPEDLLLHAGRRSRRDAERARRRAEVLGATPRVEDELRAARIGPEHVDALAAAVGQLEDDRRTALLDLDTDLAREAATSSPEEFRRFLRRMIDLLEPDDGLARDERQRARARLTFRFDHETGMGRIRGELDPESFQRVRRAVDAEARTLRRLPTHEGVPAPRVAVDALVNLTTGARSAGRRNRAEVVVHVDLDTLVDGLHERSVCEYSDGTALPPATVRRLACDAGIIPVVLGGAGQPLDVGRATRLATPAQRAALRTMYRTCAIDACDRAFDACEVHHVVEWPRPGGETDLANLVPLCSHHHHRAHEGRWRLDLDPATRILTVRLPDGTQHSRCPPDLVAARTAWIAA